MEGKLLHRIFIGVEPLVVIPPPPDPGVYFAQENGDVFISENNKYFKPENE